MSEKYYNIINKLLKALNLQNQKIVELNINFDCDGQGIVKVTKLIKDQELEDFVEVIQEFKLVEKD